MASKNVTKSKAGKPAIDSHRSYMTDKTNKLDDQFRSEIDLNREKAGTSSNIFHGVSIHVNGFTDPSSDELKRLMMLHGGMYQPYYSLSRVTHIIATNLPYAKIRQLRNERIVKPDWITESIKAGRLLPSLPYELYTDRSSRNNQSTLPFSKASTGQKEPATRKLCNASNQSDAEANSDVSVDHGASSSTERGNESESTHHDSFNQSFDEHKSFNSNSNPQARDGKSHSVATASDPNFLTEFYNNSRLHHISTWGAECKAYVNELQSKGDVTFPGKQRFLKRMTEKRKRENALDFPEDDSQEWQDDLTAETNADAVDDRPRTGLSRETSKKDKLKRVIMHIDMDCFFVSVGLVNRPDLVGKPVAVTHSKGQVGMSDTRQEIREIERAYYAKKLGTEKKAETGTVQGSGSSEYQGNGPDRVEQGSGGNRGQTLAGRDDSGKPKESSFHSMSEIASCNYEARKVGVKNGMFMGKAKSLCPELQTIPYDFEGYKRVSQILYDTIASYTHEIEAVSCDEMFVDISRLLDEAGATPSELAEFLREEIRDKTKCNASAGMGSNILLARMATRVAKPDGHFFLQPHAVDDFIQSQPVKDLPGVGRSMTRKLENLSVKTCGELQQVPLATLQKEFGPKTGQSLHRFCRGLDDRTIRQEQERKSVSAEVNYGIRFKQESDSERFVSELAAEVHKRLTAIKMLAKNITVKLKVRHPDAPKETSKFMGHGICEDKARSSTLGQATDELQVLRSESLRLLKELHVPAPDMRGVGIQLSKLCSLHGGSASSASNKSIMAFMTKPNKDSHNVSTNTAAPTTEASPYTGIREKQKVDTVKRKGARTMLNFVSKQPAARNTDSVDDVSDHHHGNQDDDDDLRRESPRKKRKRELPPLPFMPSDEDPAAQRPRTDAAELAIPSPSQIDMSVLSALPRDIQEQVMQSYGLDKKGTQRRNDALDPNEPSTSSGVTHSGQQWDQDVLQALPPHIRAEVMQSGHHGNGDVLEEQAPRRDVSTFGVVEALPSFSQVDPSILEALPAELQAELRAAYRGKAPAAKPEQDPGRPPGSRKGPDPGMSPGSRKAGSSQSRSPAKTPSKSPSKSPFKIKKRGRPRKGSPRGKANDPKMPSWQMGIQALITRNQTPPKQPKHLQSSPSNRINAISVEEEEERRIRVEEMMEEEEKEEVEARVNLCGAVELADVKALLREWIASTDEPVEEDVGFLVQYLRELILDKNLEMVSLVLKTLKRIATKKTCSSWLDAHQTITDRIQHTLTQIYGARLKTL